uniref:sacsin N-terminal ATP-binding-like domain-containing protein n=1 Tax=Nocardia concava TaxID=257281 RepID=UPI0002D4F275
MIATDLGDPFGTEQLRAGVVAAWRGSPTRLREDAATEADLVRSGYRDRLLTELAQNAADAAVKAGVPGRVAVWLDGRTLHVANSGAALDVSGVHALTALRASGKTEGAAVGKFGVGFTAVLTVSDEIELRSTSGSVRFSRAETWALLGAQGIEIPETPGGFVPPALRLAWSTEERPAGGFDSEIVLRLREDVDTVALLAEMRAEAAELLLELPALQSIRIGGDEIVSAERELEYGLTELRVTGPNSEERVWWQYRTGPARWLLPVRDGRPVAAHPDVLRAPTRSDEELSIPALLIADIPMQPDRRRLLPGAHLTELARGYADFARALPPRDRLVVVPTPGFARSEADGLLREALIDELREHEWLPVLEPSPEVVLESAPAPVDFDAEFGVVIPDSGEAAAAAAPEQADPATPPAPVRSTTSPTPRRAPRDRPSRRRCRCGSCRSRTNRLSMRSNPTTPSARTMWSRPTTGTGSTVSPNHPQPSWGWLWMNRARALRRKRIRAVRWPRHGGRAYSPAPPRNWPVCWRIWPGRW